MMTPNENAENARSACRNNATDDETHASERSARNENTSPPHQKNNKIDKTKKKYRATKVKIFKNNALSLAEEDKTNFFSNVVRNLFPNKNIKVVAHDKKLTVTTDSSTNNTPDSTPRNSNDFKPEGILTGLFRKDVAELLEPLNNIDVNHKIDFVSQFQPLLDGLKDSKTLKYVMIAAAVLGSVYLGAMLYGKYSGDYKLKAETRELRRLLVQMSVLKDEDEAVFRPEGIIDDHDIANVVTSLISFFSADSNTFNAHLSNLIKTTRITGVATTVIKFARAIFTYFARLICDDVPLFDFMHKTGVATIDEFLKDAKEVCLQFDEGTLECNVNTHRKIVDLRDQVIKMLAQMPRNDKFNEVRLVVLNIDHKLDKVLQHVKGSDYKNRGARVEPIGLMMVGPPGIGKSVSMMWFSAQILDKSGVLTPEQRVKHNENPNLFIYNRQSENVYWDGYDNQPITLYDDILQVRDVAGQPDGEAMAIIRNLNTFEHVLHCAHLDKKGNTFFSSKFVLSTSNREKFDINSITEIEAFMRRWNFIIKGRLKPEYAVDTTIDRRDWKVDHSKLPVFNGTTRITPHICDWWLQKSKPSSPGHLVDDTGLPVTPEEIVRMVVEAYSKQKDYHQAMMDMLQIPVFQAESGVDLDMDQVEDDTESDHCVEDIIVHDYHAFCVVYEKFYSHRAPSRKTYHEFMAWWQDNAEYPEEPACFSDFLHYRRAKSEKKKTFTSQLFDKAKNAFENLWLASKDWILYLVGFVFSSLKMLACYTVVSVATLVLTLYEKLSPYFLKLYAMSERHHHIPALLGLLLAIALGTLIWKMFSHDEPLPGCVKLPNGYHLGPDSNHAGERVSTHKVRRTLRSNVNKLILKPENGPVHAPAWDIVSRMYDIHWRRKGKPSIRFGSVLPVARRIFMMNQHFLNQIEAGYTNQRTRALEGFDQDTVFFTRVGDDSSKPVFELPISHMLDSNNYVTDVECSNKDVIFVMTNRTAIDFRDITKWFMDESRLDSLTGMRVSIIVSGRPPMNISSYAVYKEYQDIPDSPTFEGYRVNGVLMYSACTANGWCGSPVLDQFDKGKPLIVGIHFGGTGEHGVAAVITRQFIESKISLFQNLFITDNKVLPESGYVPQPDDEVKVLIGKIKGRAPNVSRKSKLEKSVLADFLAPIKKYPAFLATWKDETGILRDPLQDALKGYCPRPIFISPTQLESCWRGYLRFLRYTGLNAVEPVVFSYETAVTGQPFADKIGKVDRSTSAGYPYNVENSVKNKTVFYGKTGPYEFGNVEETKLRSYIDYVESKAKRRERLLHLFTDTLKDETLSKAKVDKRMARFISATPLPLLILCRRYFGAFQMFLRENLIVNGVAIGINPYSDHWAYLERYLKGFGQKRRFGAGDYKGFDKRHQTQVLWAIHDLIQEWYGKSDMGAYNVRYTLWFELVNSYHICDGFLYQWLGSLPSGHPLTSIVNCLYNHILFRMCYIDITGQEFFAANEEFNEQVTLVVLGDDNVFSYPDVTNDWHAAPFDMYGLSQAMVRYGQEYTRADKEIIEPGFSQLFEEISFLKRTFRICDVDGLTVAPLDIDSILASLQWKKRSVDESVFLSIVLRAYVELSVHSTSVWEYWSERIGMALDKNKLPRPALSDDREALVKEFRGIQDVAVAAEHTEGTFVPESAIADGGDQQIRIKRTLFINREIAMVTPDMNTNTRAQGLTQDYTMTTNEQDTNVENVALTTMANDSLVRSISVSEPVLTLSDATSPNNETFDTSIVSFLSRPTIISQGDFALTDTAGTVLYILQSPHALLASNPVWADKMNGVLSFKGTLVLRLQANASRFQQGRYILGFVYDGGCSSTYKIFSSFKTHTATLTEQTQVPHVEFDLSCDTEVVIRLPHINCVDRSIFYNNGTYTYSVGTLFLSCYSPLVAASGLTTCRYNLYAHFEDVELGFPVVPQSSAKVGVKVARKLKSSTEERAVKEGPIGDALGKMSRTADVLSDIPLLTSFTTPVSWVTATLQKAAAIWGFSKPGDSQKSTTMTPMFIDGFTNVDGLDKSNKMAFTKDAVIQHTDGLSFGGIDEMALANIITKFAYFSSFTWTTSDAENTQKAYVPMQPRYMRQTVSRFGTNTEHTTPLAYYSKFFHAYRGSIALKFKVVKTEFHSGRLSVAFIPFDRLASGTLPTASVTAAKDVHRTIVDIREGGEFTIVFPYYSATQYRKLCENSDGVYGYVDIRVLNTLVAPDTVNASVTVLIEAAGCSDMEFAIPEENTTNALVFVPESGACSIMEDTNGAVRVRRSLAPSAHAIGEKIHSVRSLIKRFCPIYPKGYIDGGASWTSMYIFPWTLWSGSVTSGALTRGNYRSDNTSLLLAPFSLVRGSARAKVLSRRTDERQLISGLKQYAVGGGNVGPIQFSDALVLPYLYDHIPNTEPTSIARLNLTGALEVEVPYYSRTIASPVMELTTSTTGSSAVSGDSCVPSSYLVVFRNDRSEFVPADFAVYRALGDDASASLFMSTVPLVDW